MKLRFLLSFMLVELFVFPATAQNAASLATSGEPEVQLISDERITILRSDTPGQMIVLSNAAGKRKRFFGCPDSIPVLCCPPKEAAPIVQEIRPINNPDPVVAPVKRDPFFLPDPVFFRINKYVIDASEWAKIELAVNYLNENPASTCVVTGYADKKTGNTKINMKLSEQRSNEVAKAMETKYGIAKNRISVNWKGDGLQPFQLENDKNRAVLFLINP
jgi:outer membrane protein OmpA-like peptidoglycan-associated protein